MSKNGRITATFNGMVFSNLTTKQAKDLMAARPTSAEAKGNSGVANFTPNDVLKAQIKAIYQDGMTPPEFVLKCLALDCGTTKKGTPAGLHSVWSGFNGEVREHFNMNPIELTDAMRTEGVIEIVPTSGGVHLYRAGSVTPKSTYILRKATV